MTNPRVAIVIVTWNKKSDVLKLLESLRRIDYDNHDIVVVDNASTDGSAAKIVTMHPEARLLVNKENLGGSGGFNTGINYVLERNAYKYIWLLDNDAEVDANALRELVQTAERDNTIGVAGSCIMSPENRDLIVEAGASIDWKSGAWSPNFRYHRISDVQDETPMDVDYVPACSALIREDVIRLIGGLDERFFLHWDDIDYCIRVKRNGFRVVCVTSSMVYHSVEKGFNPLILYYDFRNGLLICDKHRSGMERLRTVFAILNTAFRARTHFLLNGERSRSRLLMEAIKDYRAGRFGRISVSRFGEDNEQQLQEVSSLDLRKLGNSIVVCANGTYEAVKKTISEIRVIAPGCRLTLLVQRGREKIFDACGSDGTIQFDLFKGTVLEAGRTFIKLALGKYTSIVSVGTSYTVPFVYAFRRHYVYDGESGVFHQSPNNVTEIWKVALTLIGGFIGACMTLPVVSRRRGL
jgi:GT2 family glycosyltransferase